MITPPPEPMGTYEQLHELHNIACAAAHSLKCIDWHLEKRCDEDDFTYEDAAGCSYNIKRALHFFSESIRYQGLKCNPLYPEWGKPLSEMLSND